MNLMEAVFVMPAIDWPVRVIKQTEKEMQQHLYDLKQTVQPKFILLSVEVIVEVVLVTAAAFVQI